MSPKRRQMPSNLAATGAARVATAFAGQSEVAPSTTERAARKSARRVAVSAFRLQPHPLQPAERHATDNVGELKVSISELGLIEPPLVWRRPDSSYVILAGHRRWHAWKLLVAEENRDSRMPAYVLDGISSAEAVRIIAAEYCHRREFSVLHTARIVGAAHETLRQNGDGDVSLRQLAAVLPLGRTSLGQYLVISQGLQNPKLAPLVHSVDKPSKTMLYKALSHPGMRTKMAALEAMQPKPEVVQRTARSGSRRNRTKAVRHRKRGKGFDLSIEVRSKMEASEVRRVRDALLQAIADIDVLFPQLRGEKMPGLNSSD